MREIILSIQAKNGMNAAVFIWMAATAFTTLAAFVFFCVTAYGWLAARYDTVTAGLVMAGCFVLIALVSAVICVMARRRARERAILARAARAHGSSWLLDPKILATAVEAGRTLGWQRIVPVALIGFMAAQWAREYREGGEEHL